VAAALFRYVRSRSPRAARSPRGFSRSCA
jgi:hypothetical protein